MSTDNPILIFNDTQSRPCFAQTAIPNRIMTPLYLNRAQIPDRIYCLSPLNEGCVSKRSGSGFKQGAA